MASNRLVDCAGGVVFRRGTGKPKYLLIHDAHRNWGFPKGHLIDGEAPARAAVREVCEETGLGHLIRHGTLCEIDWAFQNGDTTVHKHCHFFLFESETEVARPQHDEGISACGWFGYRRARSLLRFENARRVLDRASEMVGRLEQGATADRS